MDSLHTKTPLLLSRPLSVLLKRDVYLKLDNLQPTGSFKNRGIGALCQKYQREGATAFVCSSGGNAGLAAAYSGRLLNISVKVFVPETTLGLMREKIEREGAEVIVFGKQWSEADAMAKSLVCEKKKIYYIPPFDHPTIWQGNSTFIDEIVEEGLKPEAIVLAVGGGGLLCGAVLGLQRYGLTNTAILAAEPQGAASLHEAVKANALVSLERVDTIATSLAARQVSSQAFAYTKSHPITSLVVTDGQALEACLRFAQDHYMLIEPSCGVALALLYGQREEVFNYDPIVVMVCGGQAVSLDLLAKWKEKLL